MVRIIGYKERTKEDGTTFFVLELQDDILMVRSQTTGNIYATAKRTFVPSTFDEQTCMALVGTELSGVIMKEDCDPYEYVVKETGEEIVLNHRWVYIPEEDDPIEVETSPKPTEEQISNVKQLSKNTVLDYA